MKCPKHLVYNPNTNKCDWPNNMPCKTIKTGYLTTATPSTTSPPNRCTNKPDGNYTLPDVFKYLECKDGREIIHKCPSDQIYEPGEDKCISVTDADKSSFCDYRIDGQYRNPWNCHHFISCSGQVVYDMKCHPLSLVYDPGNNLCEWPVNMPCKQLPGEQNVSVRYLSHPKTLRSNNILLGFQLEPCHTVMFTLYAVVHVTSSKVLYFSLYCYGLSSFCSCLALVHFCSPVRKYEMT